jgi:hypothetical protein
MVQTLPRLPGPPEKDLITLAFCIWLHRNFDELVKDINDTSLRRIKTDAMGDLR